MALSEKTGATNPSALTHVSAKCPNIVNYWFLGASGSVTIKGIFVRRDGSQTGVAISTTILVGNGSNPPQNIVAIASIPDDAVAFVGNTSANVYMALYDPGVTALVTDFTNNYANYPLIATGNALNFGSVAMV